MVNYDNHKENVEKKNNLIKENCNRKINDWKKRLFQNQYEVVKWIGENIHKIELTSLKWRLSNIYSEWIGRKITRI